MTSITYEHVPQMRVTEAGFLVPTKQYKEVMRAADKCVGQGGHFTGFSEYKPVRRYPHSRDDPTTVLIEHITITLHYMEHPHVTFARHRRRRT